ncbi:LysE family translocator [Kitasatospora sp. NPDC093806]|uniref:LysE family translocator n=1 Tax=Kitasatospora sp. NPDC093806 TaxID=3155075 RepID=UPI0034219937
MTTSLPAFILATLLLIAVPGPNLVYILTRSVQDGRRAGLVSALGIETGTLVHVTAAVAGLATLVADHPLAFATLRYAGAGYLAYLGLRTLLTRPSTAATAPPARPLRHIYRDAVLVNLLNPKVVLFFLAFLPQFLPTSATRADMLLLGLVFLTIALVMDLSYALTAAALTPRLRTHPRPLAYATGGVYLGLAALVFL